MKYMEYLQNLSMSVNMSYVNTTLDVEAAINAYKLIWNFQDKFSNIVIHLGAFTTGVFKALNIIVPLGKRWLTL